ncbi:hypothetical protein [Amnibacterium endophyticum]|uniref:HTH araC/xylS-type domain-containing protein n=1 Tax=Amnibacterium endophyticum TaxID=2109337 RepID=A0ABW4LAA2_9MICO
MPEVIEHVHRGRAPVPLEPGLLSPLGPEEWRVRIRSLEVDGARADYLDCDPHRFDVPPLEERPEGRLPLMLVVVLSGRSDGVVGGRRVPMAPQRALLLDGRAGMTFEVSEPLRAMRLLVDLAHLPPDLLGRMGEPCLTLKDTPLVLGCVGLISGLLQVHNGTVEPHDETAVSQPLIALQASLLEEALRERPSGDPIPSSRRECIEVYVEEHLGDRSLSVASIAASLGVTVRTVHAAFEGTSDTVGALVRRRRVARAQTVLALRTDPPNVGALAARVGLTRDQLTRIFRAETGRTVVEWWREHHER